MNNTETVKEEIVYYNEQVVYEEGVLTIKSKDRQFNCPTVVTVFGITSNITAGTQTIFTLYLNGVFYSSLSQYNIDENGEEEAVKNKEEIIQTLLNGYAKYGPAGRPKKQIS